MVKRPYRYQLHCRRRLIVNPHRTPHPHQPLRPSSSHPQHPTNAPPTCLKLPFIGAEITRPLTFTSSFPLNSPHPPSPSPILPNALIVLSRQLLDMLCTPQVKQLFILLGLVGVLGFEFEPFRRGGRGAGRVGVYVPMFREGKYTCLCRERRRGDRGDGGARMRTFAWWGKGEVRFM